MAAPLASFAVTSLFDIVKGWFKSEEDARKLTLQIESVIARGQLKINLEESKSKRLFIAGWRPAIGWMGVLTLATNYLLLAWVEIYVYLKTGQIIELPRLDTGPILALVVPMLGIGGFRTIEKMTGKTR